MTRGGFDSDGFSESVLSLSPHSISTLNYKALSFNYKAIQ
ncbi:hypothetical protein K239x_16680 [Planctomycetes bacterium K23_9]|uniref:Uncharacterized protein n=1 Tax=Stieleria marina TaxID=1930275 RepID=A0A517NRF8_9BACT|nr:hypothetical protein K239x_16680 [Planctomycetes bacterium K23_9]